MSLRPVSRAVSVVAALLLSMGSPLAAPGDPIGTPSELAAPTVPFGTADLARLPDGRAIHVWLAPTRPDYLTAYHLMVQRIAADGSAQGPALRVDASPATVGNARVAVDAAGNFVIAWEQYAVLESGIERQGRIFQRRYSANGTPLSAPLPVDTAGLADEYDQTNPAIAMNALGQFVITWHTYRRVRDDPPYWQVYEGPILARRYAANGTALAGTEVVAERKSGPFRVYPSGFYGFGVGFASEYASDGPAVDMGPDGGFVVAWTSGSVTGVVAGLPILRQRLSAGLQSVQAQRFDSAGNKLGKPSQAISLVSWEAVFDGPTVALTPDGGYALAWIQYQPLRLEASRRGTFMRRYDASGKALGLAPVEVFRDKPTYSGPQSPLIEADANGNIIIAVRPLGEPGQFRSIASRVFGPDSRALGPMTLAGQLPNTTSAGLPRISLHANGDYQLSWAAGIWTGSSNRGALLTQRIDGP